MDYSLLVGIHDPSIPRSAEVSEDEEEEDFDYTEDGQGHYISSDELDPPQSPSSATGETGCCFFHMTAQILRFLDNH